MSDVASAARLSTLRAREAQPFLGRLRQNHPLARRRSTHHRTRRGVL